MRGTLLNNERTQPSRSVCSVRCHQRISPGYQENPLRTADTTVDLQPDRMPCIEAARWPVGRVPTWCPFARVAIKWRGVQAQPRNNCECVTLARVDRDPFTGSALAVAAELGRTHRRADQTRRPQRIGDRSRTIVAMIIE